MHRDYLHDTRLKIIHGCDFSDWVSSRIARLPYKLKGTCIGFGDDQRLLAAIVFHDYTGRSIQCSIAADSPAWCSRRALREAFAYVFGTCGCVRLTVMVASDNERSRSLVTRLGFVLEGRMRDHYDDGVDLLIYGMKKSEAQKRRWF